MAAELHDYQFAPGFWACYDWENTNEEGTMDVTQEAEWSTAFVNDLPDASFALILPGGEKDDDGKTTPRDLRKLPYKDGEGEVDIPHLRNALARISQVEGASDDEIEAAQEKLQRAADEQETPAETSESDPQSDASLDADDTNVAAVAAAERLRVSLLTTTAFVEIDGDVRDFSYKVISAFDRAFEPETNWRNEKPPSLCVLALLYGDSDLGNGVIVRDEKEGCAYLVGYTDENGEIVFTLRNEWKPVINKWIAVEPMEANESESDETITNLSETAMLTLSENESPENRRAPLRMDVGIIRVGPGNKRDNHYYTQEMLERDGHIFEGAKMYATDHRDDERSVRTEVSILESIEGVRELGDALYLVGRAVVFNPDFAEDVRNRADANVLDSLHCSILAQGEANPGKIGEDEYNIVQRITEVKSVDWVTRAGAGGHALQLAESAAAPEPEPAPEPLDEAEAQPVTISENDGEEAIQSLPLAEVVRTLGKTNLPAASVAALSETEYEDVAAVNAAVDAEIKRLKAAGSGQPLGIQAAKQRPSRSMAEIQAEIQAVNHKWLGR